ncbi:MAG: hypothetical protein PHI12_08520 [Dehalococcoidales bacterium]|nr:hypothetical protein [Dehalococcoidales bacterium]
MSSIGELLGKKYGDTKTQSGEGKTDKDKFQETLDLANDAAKLRIVEGIGGTKGVVEKQADKTTLDISGVIKAQSEQINSLMTNLVTLITAKKDNVDPFFEYMKGELRDMKEQLSGNDPLAAIANNMAVMKSLTDQMKQHLGIGAPVAGTGDNINLMLEIEKLKGDREESARRWQAERDDIHHRWEIEDKKWTADYNMAVNKLSSDSKGREGAATMAQDLIGSAIEAFDAGRRGVAAGAQATPPVQYKLPKSIICEECKKEIVVPEDHNPSQPVVCACGEKYNFGPK